MRYHELTESEALTPLAKRVERERKRRSQEAKQFHSDNDEYKSQQREDIINGAKLIKKNCQPYLAQVNDPMSLRRGVNRDYDADPQAGRPMFNKKKSHLSDRKPRGSSMQIWHSVVNDYFTAEFGHPFRNATMTTGDQLHSSGFGTDVAVFPIGNFKFLWSRHVKDINHQFRQDGWDIQGSKQRLLNAIAASEYQTTDLQAAIDSKNEIMIWAEEYYTLDNNADRMLVKKLLK
jgi:hypothetical protein